MNVNGYVSAILVGIVIGILGRLVLPGKQRLGFFITFLIGVGAALLGLFVSHARGLDDNLPAHLWKVDWHWSTLAIQVGIAVVAIGIGNVMTYTRLSDGGKTTTRKRSTRRRRSPKNA